jgi:hypothetical protein
LYIKSPIEVARKAEAKLNIIDPLTRPEPYFKAINQELLASI